MSGLACDPDLTVFGKPVEAVGYALARRVLTQPRPPTALFTGSKLLTLGALRYLWDHHLRVPEDVALAAFDDLDWLPNSPEMLNVTQPAYDIGLKAAELLLAWMGEPGRPPELHVLPSSVAWVGRQGVKGLA